MERSSSPLRNESQFVCQPRKCIVRIFFYLSRWSHLCHMPPVITLLCYFYLHPSFAYPETSDTSIFPHVALSSLPFHFITKIALVHIPLMQRELVATLFLLSNRTPLLFGAEIVPDKRSHFPVSLANRVVKTWYKLEESSLKRAASQRRIPFLCFLSSFCTEKLMAGAPAAIWDQEVTLRTGTITKMAE